MPDFGYGAGRDEEYLSRLDDAIEAFATLYEEDLSADRTTIILFPGGMGSKLKRARMSYKWPPFSYYTSWLACNIILLGEARHLQLMAGGVDYKKKYVIPDGGVDFFKVHPYSGFIDWCKQNRIHLFVFGCDWRRGVQDSVDFFLDKFMPKFDARFAGYAPHPLDNFSLVGHSSGGMVAKVIANQTGNQYVDRMKRAITVATPFYGYGAQIHRFLKGEEDLNVTLGGPDAAGEMTRIISSMPGVYEYLYLDQQVYLANKAAFETDSDGYNLMAYPSLDKADNTEFADPYNPLPDAQQRVRYPANYGFDMGMLHDGMAASRKVSCPLDAEVAAKFYNIRGVQAKYGIELNETVVSQVWGRVPPEFDPDQDSDPIDDFKGHGDGVQPAWTARLLGLPDPANQVITIVDDVEHMTMMNTTSVQESIASLLGLHDLTFVPQVEEPIASRAELNKFLDGLRAEVMDKPRTRVRVRKVIIEYLSRFKRDVLQGFLARAYIDALKSRSQKVSPSKSPKRVNAAKHAAPRGTRGRN